MNYWQGKRAVITGGSAGLGRAIAAALAERGARVAIIARGEAALNQAADELRQSGSEILAIPADVTRDDDVNRVAAKVLSAWGGVDLVCHCAGRSMRGEALSTSIDDFRELWELNFLSAVRCIQVLAEPLANSHGHVVLVGSLASKVAPRYLGAYPASKFPLAALAQQLRLEWAASGVHVLLVCPGPIARAGEASVPECESSTAPAGRYVDQASPVPAEAHRPGGGAKVAPVTPARLAEQILASCERRESELIVPGRARLLFAISQLSPRAGDWLLRKMTTK